MIVIPKNPNNTNNVNVFLLPSNTFLNIFETFSIFHNEKCHFTKVLAAKAII